MGVGLAHQFIGALGRGVERDGMVGAVLHAERQAVIAAIDRGG